MKGLRVFSGKRETGHHLALQMTLFKDKGRTGEMRMKTESQWKGVDKERKLKG